MGLFEFVLGLLRGNMHVAVSFAGEWSKWSARITSHINGTKCGAIPPGRSAGTAQKRKEQKTQI